MRAITVLLVTALGLGAATPIWSQGAPGGWRLMEARDGIIVFRQFHQQSQLETFRGTMRMDLADEYSMLALYNDTEAFPDWLHLFRAPRKSAVMAPWIATSAF